MRLPNWEKAIILSPKLRGYLLSAEHPHGRFKAHFFARFGFAADSWKVLGEALKVHAATHEVLSFEDTPFGTRYTVGGQINAPMVEDRGYARCGSSQEERRSRGL